MSYTPPSGDQVALKLSRPPFAGQGDQVAVTFADAVQFIQPIGLAATQFGTATVALNSTQVLRPSSVGNISAFGAANVHGGAQTIHPDPFVSFASGTAKVWNYQTKPTFTGFSALSFGTTVVKNGTPQLFPPGVASLTFGSASLQLHTRFVRPTGYAGYASGTAWVSLRVRTITPSGFASQAFGTSQWLGGKRFIDFTGKGYATSAFGAARVSYRVQSLAATGINASAFGQALVAFRVRTVAPTGTSTLTVGAPVVHLRFNQTADLTGDGIAGPLFGTAFMQLVKRQALAKGFDASAFGTANVQNWRRYLAPQGLVGAIGSPTLELFNRSLPLAGFDASKFGTATLQLKRRYLAVAGWDASSVGAVDIELKRRWIFTAGFSQVRFGAPYLSGGDSGPKPIGFSAMAFGAAKVRTNHVAPAGLASLTFGAVKVFNFNQSAKHTGLASLEFGTTWVSTKPQAIKQKPGTEMTTWGTPGLELWRRFMLVAGTDTSVVATPSQDAFELRMRVRRPTNASGVGMGVTTAFGAARLSYSLHAIGANGFGSMEMGRVTLRLQNRMHPVGFDALVVGDVQRWEAGKVKPYGADLASFGRAILSRVMQPSGISGQLGTPRMGQPIGADGFDAFGAGDATMVAAWCGDRALAQRGFDAAAFGRAAVAEVA